MNLSRILSKKIPTILGLFFLGAGLTVGIIVVGKGTGGFFPKASPETSPKHFKITNITDTGFTVSFVTDTASPSYIKYGTSPSKLDTRIADDRDQLSGSVGEYTTHHITARNLSASTPYYFEIGTSTQYMYSENDQPYSVTTAPKLGGSPSALTAYGNVVTKAGTPGKDAIVYLTIDSGSPVSTLVKSTGGWAVAISTARTQDFQSYISTQNSASVQLFVQGKDDSQTSTISTTVENAQPVETITLGSESAASSSSSSATSQTSTQPEMNVTPNQQLIPTQTPAVTTPASAKNVTFINPAKEGEAINSTQPELRGKGPKNTTMTVTVESDPVYSSTVTTDSTGNWTYVPDGDLSPGEHTITVTYTDENGEAQTTQRTFTVLAQGTSSLPATVSTPSATPKTTPTPTPTARVAQPSTSSGVPKSGSIEETFVLLALGIASIVIGFALWHKNLESKT